MDYEFDFSYVLVKKAIVDIYASKKKNLHDKSRTLGI